MLSLPLLSPRTLAIGNAVAFIVNTIITFTSNAPIYGKTNGQVSSLFPTLLTPSGWAFSIWGFIFAAQGVWTAWQVVPRNHSNRFTACIGVWWWVVCAAQCGWTFAFAQEQIGLALAFMLLILLALAIIAAALSKHRAVARPSSLAFTNGRVQFVQLPLLSLVSDDAATDASASVLSVFEWWVNFLPFSIHLAWISIATVANINISFVASNAPASTQLAAAIVTLFCPVAFAFWSSLYRSDAVTPAVVSWALFAVAQKTSRGLAPFDAYVTSGIAAAAYFLACVCAAAASAAALLALAFRMRAVLQPSPVTVSPAYVKQDNGGGVGA